jgi:hypothetical protein
MILQLKGCRVSKMSFDTKTQHSMPKHNLVFSLQKAQFFKYQMLFIYPGTKEKKMHA